MFAMFEAAMPEPTSWMQIAAMVSSLGFAVWYAWYATTNTIPKLQENHTILVEKIVNKHAETIDQTVKEFRSETKEQRELYERRAQSSAELARQGQAAMVSLAQSVSEISKTVERESFKSKQG